MARVTEFGRPCFFCFVWANPLYTRSIPALYPAYIRMELPLEFFLIVIWLMKNRAE